MRERSGLSPLLGLNLQIHGLKVAILFMVVRIRLSYSDWKLWRSRVVATESDWKLWHSQVVATELKRSLFSAAQPPWKLVSLDLDWLVIYQNDEE